MGVRPSGTLRFGSGVCVSTTILASYGGVAGGQELLQLPLQLENRFVLGAYS